MTNDGFLDQIRELEVDLFSREFRQWVRKQPEDMQARIRSLRTEISIYRSQLETAQLKVLANKLDELSPELTQGVTILQKEMDEMNDFIAVLDVLGRVIGLISRIVTLVA